MLKNVIPDSLIPDELEAGDSFVAQELFSLDYIRFIVAIESEYDIVLDVDRLLFSKNITIASLAEDILSGCSGK
ncbi:hypothetical protein [Paenibacillus albidus]|uniref:hypothetical protein n=1 Tax=Paenibacillus albidus TaxID=2041023 RepID=UPI00166D9996|nr:hypothetical protein [Paenibacillus albidus]